MVFSLGAVSGEKPTSAHARRHRCSGLRVPWEVFDWHPTWAFFDGEALPGQRSYKTALLIARRASHSGASSVSPNRIKNYLLL
jgi:hypothetical protein